MEHPPVKVGIVGCGNISGVYFKNARRMKTLQPVACADRVAERAEAPAVEYGLRACTVEALLADPEIELVINLTVPKAHAAVDRAAIEAGKSVYQEKPLAVCLADARAVLGAAAAKGVRVGGAPDTFLGAGLQTCRGLIDAGAIGRPVRGGRAKMPLRRTGETPVPQSGLASPDSMVQLIVDRLRSRALAWSGWRAEQNEARV